MTDSLPPCTVKKYNKWYGIFLSFFGPALCKGRMYDVYHNCCVRTPLTILKLALSSAKYLQPLVQLLTVNVRKLELLDTSNVYNKCFSFLHLYIYKKLLNLISVSIQLMLIGLGLYSSFVTQKNACPLNGTGKSNATEQKTYKRAIPLSTIKNR